MTTTAVLADPTTASTSTAKAARQHGSHRRNPEAGKNAGTAVFPDVLASLADRPKDAHADSKVAGPRRELKVPAETKLETRADGSDAGKLAALGPAEAEEIEPDTTELEPPGADDDVRQLASLLLPQPAKPDNGDQSETRAANAGPSPTASQIADELTRAAAPQPESTSAPQPGTGRVDLPSDAGLEVRLPAGRTEVAVLAQEAHFSPVPAQAGPAPVVAAANAPPGAAAAEDAAASLAADIEPVPASAPGATDKEPAAPRRARGDAPGAVSPRAEPETQRVAAPDADAGDRPDLADDHRASTASARTALGPDADASTVFLSAPARQVAAAVTAELATSSAGTSALLVTQATETSTGTGTVLKVLHIKLEPESLGTVTVRMSLRDNALELKIEAASPETADLIKADRDALSGLLRASGYAIDAPVVTIARSDAGATAPLGQQSGSAQPQLDLAAQNQQGSPGSSRHQSNEHAGRGDAPGTNEANGTETRNDTGDRGRAGSGLYV